MFKRQVEAVLKSYNPSTDRDWRVAYCQLHVTVDYLLAQEISPKIADRLFRLSGSHVWEPCLELRQVSFSELKFQPQHMEVRGLPDKAAPLIVEIPGVEIVRTQGCVLKKAKDMTLAMNIRFMFSRTQSPKVAEFVIERLGDRVWLTFTKMQSELIVKEETEVKDETIGELMNKRNSKKTRQPLMRIEKAGRR